VRHCSGGETQALPDDLFWPGSSTIRVRNPANENDQYVDPKNIPLLSIKQSATTIRISGRAARELLWD
jgi:hypothetical protein